MNYDAVICVAPKHLETAAITIRSLLRFTRAGTVHILSPKQVHADLELKFSQWIAEGRIALIDEVGAFPAVDVEQLRSMFKKRTGAEKWFGWYLQQFLKMAAADLSGIGDHYLIWDSDTVLLQDLEFFDEEGRTLVVPETEHHLGYFRLMEKLLGFGRQVDHSFIAEHLMVNKEYMRGLMAELQSKAPPNKPWPEWILDSIDDADICRSGFSEYETYGNYVAMNYSDSYALRRVKSTRRGTELYGKADRYALASLMGRGFVYASFETWHRPPGLWRRIRRACSHHFTWKWSCSTGRRGEQREIATELAEGH